jgi:hypothetical protein
MDPDRPPRAARCDVCGAVPEYRATLIAKPFTVPPEGFSGGVDLCAPCVAEGVPPGWHLAPLAESTPRH